MSVGQTPDKNWTELIEEEGMSEAGSCSFASLSLQRSTVCVFPLLYGPVLAQVPRIQGQGTASQEWAMRFPHRPTIRRLPPLITAGMTQLRGVDFMTGALLSGGTTTFTSPTGVTATGDRNGSLAWPPPGHLYVTANLKDLGVTAPG